MKVLKINYAMAKLTKKQSVLIIMWLLTPEEIHHWLMVMVMVMMALH